MRILVVEDDSVFQEMIAREMGDEIDLAYADTLAQASQSLESDRFDCALLDLRLPDGDGLGFLPRLVEAGIPVIFLTAQGSEETAVQAMKGGAEDYLVKGSATDGRLRRAVENGVERARLRDDVRRHEREKDELITKLQDALESVETLEGLLPICAGCKKIRDDEGFWQAVETYITKRTSARFSHGLCPECCEQAMRDLPESSSE